MKIRLAIFDWAGTLVDFGCRAPLIAFLESFAAAGLPISEELARRPMGTRKYDHITEILDTPEIRFRARTELGREPDELLANEIYQGFNARLPALLPRHAGPIPGAAETIAWLRQHRIPVGSTTGYTRAMLDLFEPAARAAGIAPDAVVCADEVPQSRPAPWACLRIAEQLGAFPMGHCLKIGDTPADMAEGRNAGMIALGIVDTGNEIGLDQSTLATLSADDLNQRRAGARQRLHDAGANDVLAGVHELPAWIERHTR